MLTGSVVSSLQGEPRATHDIDVVVVMGQTDLQKFTSSFPSPAFYLDGASVLAATKEKGMFNLIDTREGIKVDFRMLTDDAFDLTRFERRQKKQLFGKEVYVSTPEDTIVSKLKWTSLSGGSVKHFTDALRVYEVQAGVLDTAYIEKWMNDLNLRTLWESLLRQVEPPHRSDRRP